MLWMSLLLIAMAGKMLLPRTLPDVGSVVVSQWAVLYGCATALASAHFLRRPPAGLERKWLIVAAAAGVAALLRPAAGAVPVGLIGVSLAALCLLPARHRISLAVARGVLFTSAMLLVAILFSCFYLRWESNHHHVLFLNPVVLMLLRLLDQPVWIDNGILTFLAPDGEQGVSITMEKLEAHVLLTMMLCGAVTLFVRRAEKAVPRTLSVMALLLAYGILRFIILTAVYVQSPAMAIWWNDYIVLLTLTPVALILNRLVPMPDPGTPEEGEGTPGPIRAWVRPVLLGSLFLGVWAGVYAWDAAGRQKAGRIVLDEGHSHWEWTTEELDRHVYGVKTVYNYSCLKKLLGYFFSRVTSNQQELTDDVLSQCDVLVLKTPGEAYTGPEVRAIREFVRRGGGLWLIGDHTNIFGMCSHLNQVARGFGISFNPDAVSALPGGRQIWRPWGLLPHPMVQHMPPFLFATSDSLCISGPVSAALLGTNLVSDNPNYSQNTFFGDFVCDGRERYGAFVQAAATTFGKGRVAAFTDSTVFSNFTMFMPGEPTLALCTVDWLNRMNRLPGLHTAGRAGLIVMLAVWLFSLAGLPRPQMIFAASLCGAVGLFLVLSLRLLQSEVFYPLPREHTPYTTVAFEQKHCDYHLPTLSPTEKDTVNAYQTFYVWTQRLGLIPCIQDGIGQACAGSRAVVFIRPDQDFTPAELTRLQKYVAAGGGLLVIDDPDNRRSTSGPLLQAFGLSLYRPPENVPPRELTWTGPRIEGPDQPAEARIANTKPVWHIQGGNGLLVSELNQKVIAAQPYGKGRVIVCTAGYLFDNRSMGGVDAIPSRYQWVVWSIMYSLFDQLLGRPQDIKTEVPCRAPL